MPVIYNVAFQPVAVEDRYAARIECVAEQPVAVPGGLRELLRKERLRRRDVLPSTDDTGGESRLDRLLDVLSQTRHNNITEERYIVRSPFWNIQ
jgi:hypothetical protein